MTGRLRNIREKAQNFLLRRPLTAFFLLTALLFGIIAFGHAMRQPEALETETGPAPKAANIFVPGSAPAVLALPAEVKKERFLTVSALAPGIVSAIHTAPGKKVSRGQILLELTSDYQSGAAALERARAEEQHELTVELARIDKRIQELEEKSIKRDATLTSLEEDIELRNLKREREIRRSSVETSRLTLEIARRNDAALKPKSLVTATVESLPVTRGEYVTAGTVLATLRATTGALTLEARVSRETAGLLDPGRPAVLELGNEKHEIFPIYISGSETTNGLFSVLYTLPESLNAEVTHGELIELSVPLRTVRPESILVPIDAVFQDAEHAWVLVDESGTAMSRSVTVGRIHGSFVEVTSGLSADTRIILDRSVLAGDTLAAR